MPDLRDAAREAWSQTKVYAPQIANLMGGVEAEGGAAASGLMSKRLAAYLKNPELRANMSAWAHDALAGRRGADKAIEAIWTKFRPSLGPSEAPVASAASVTADKVKAMLAANAAGRPALERTAAMAMKRKNLLDAKASGFGK